MTTTTKAAHTPGPWQVGSVVGDDGTVFNPSHVSTAGPADESIAQVYGVPLHCTLQDIQHSGSWDRGLANARLIAAAPEMLEALQLFRDSHCGSNPLCHKCEKAEAAIQKAGGQ